MKPHLIKPNRFKHLRHSWLPVGPKNYSDKKGYDPYNHMPASILNDYAKRLGYVQCL